MIFICDVMLGKLTRYLRILGLDTLYIKGYRELTGIIERSKPYYFFTRRTKNVPQGSILIRSDHIKEQIEEVLPIIAPYIEKRLILSRCLDCNTVLVDTEKREIEGGVPEFVYHRHDRFKVCPSCKKIYWGGTHTENMKRFIESLFGDSQSPADTLNIEHEA
jgi:uncharacterized protein with PIN domain